MAGLVQDEQQSRRVRLLLHRGAPVAFMLFFALVGTSLELGALWPPVAGLYEAALVLVTVPLILRGLAPMAYYPLPGPHPHPGFGWRLLPRGALLFELFYGPHGLAPYLGAEGLVAQVVLLDILFSTLLFSSLAALVDASLLAAAKARPAKDGAAA